MCINNNSKNQTITIYELCSSLLGSHRGLKDESWWIAWFLISSYPGNTNMSAYIVLILGRLHNCRHCWPDNNQYRAIIGPMSTEFPMFCADNSTADVDEISETDIGPISGIQRIDLNIHYMYFFFSEVRRYTLPRKLQLTFLD